MFKKLQSFASKHIPLRIQKIFFGSMIISAGKIIVSFLILYLLANTKDGAITSYGNYQNIITILVALIGLSVQNGVATYTARSDIEGSRLSVIPHLITIFMVGFILLSLVFIGVELWEIEAVSALIGLSEGRFTFFILVTTAVFGVLLNYFCAVLTGKGLVVRGQFLGFLRSLLLMIFIGMYVLWNVEFNLLWALFFSHAIIIPFLLKKVIFDLKFIYRPKLDSATIEMGKTGIVTMYNAVLLASASIFVRNTAIDYGGYSLSDLFEILIRFKVMYHLAVSAPLALILLRSYASAKSRKTFYLASKALPIMLIPILGLLILPDALLELLLLSVFNKEFHDFKLVLLLLVAAETVRAMGLFFHSFLVSKAMVIPQILFLTLTQAIILVTVIKFSTADTFIVHYFVGYFSSQVIWLALNYAYVRSINKDDESVINH